MRERERQGEREANIRMEEDKAVRRGRQRERLEGREMEWKSECEEQTERAE